MNKLKDKKFYAFIRKDVKLEISELNIQQQRTTE